MSTQFDIVVSATAMHFPSYIKITDAELEAAKVDALARSEPELFEAWLETSWVEWERQERHETALEIKLEDLPRTTSLRRSMANRASWRGLLGSKIHDPVRLHGNTWSLAELLRHWVPTGMDLHNRVTSPTEMKTKLKRC